jgi:16S rRNA (guanine527-N7)-methyltransferase
LRVGALDLGLPLSGEQLGAFRFYLEEILRWSAAVNITALRSPLEIVRAGFLDSLACVPLIPADAQRLLDIGSGAGFPALPIAIVCSHLHFTLVEASRKKASFLRHLVRGLQLPHVRILQCRAETLAAQPGEARVYDVALARAVEPLPDVCRLVRPFLATGALFLAQVGEGWSHSDTSDRLMAPGFRLAGERSLPASLGRGGRRVLALRKGEG